MLFKFVHRYKYAFFWVYSFFALAMMGVVGYIVYQQSHCDTCTFAGINPSTYLVPIIAYLSIGLVAVTIGFNRKTASEKNALDFAKEMTALTPHMKALAEIRKGMLLNNGNLNRRKASEYMESLSGVADPTSAASTKTDRAGAEAASHDQTKAQVPPTDDQGETVPPGSAKEKKQAEAGSSADAKTETGNAEDSDDASSAPKPEDPASVSQAELDWNNRVAAFALLNALESCANAVRYEIYDEDFIYNIYGSHFIEWYELCYGLIKTRQLKQERIWVNFEWLAVKWTLRRNITGVISGESLKTSYIINEALQALKSHNKIRPIKRQLRKLEKKLERRKFPM